VIDAVTEAVAAVDEVTVLDDTPDAVPDGVTMGDADDDVVVVVDGDTIDEDDGDALSDARDVLGDAVTRCGVALEQSVGESVPEPDVVSDGVPLLE